MGDGRPTKGKNLKKVTSVSVPLRGKEGGGPRLRLKVLAWRLTRVSVPLRGKEGGGRSLWRRWKYSRFIRFPSPCGVRRVGDPWFLETLYDAVFKVRF